MSRFKSSEEFIEVTSPSNIAFVKYWGKYGIQKPINPSVSMTLKQCTSRFKVFFSTKEDSIISHFEFEGCAQNSFKDKIESFLQAQIDSFPILKDHSISISCDNSFPHSSGIASSASSMSALVFAIASFQNKKAIHDLSIEQMSSLARLASGSASRSLFSKMSHWGKSSLPKSSDDFALPLLPISDVFEDLNDAILIIDKGVKSVSSTTGHKLMDDHIYRNIRIEQANNNLEKITNAISSGNLSVFGQVLEEEALSLHSLMMTSNPSFILMKPNTLKSIERIRTFRNETNAHCYFTLDAGANLHLLYPASDKAIVEEFIDNSLKELCVDNEVIYDQMGMGPIIKEVSLE